MDWKHPDDVLTLAKRLKCEGRKFHISIVGDGEMKNELESMREAYGLSEYITFLGSVSVEKVREYMEKASIYLFTSDKKEGWGAVLNEAMNSGCAVVASDAAGSTPYLMKNGENGMVYHSGNMEELYQSVVKLLDSPKLCSSLGVKAYETIVNDWNAENAATCLIRLAEQLLSDEKKSIGEAMGPCSQA